MTIGFWIHRKTTPVTTVGINVRAVGRASTDSPPFLVGELSDGKSFVKTIPELAKYLATEGRTPVNETTLKNSMSCLTAHVRSTIPETKGHYYPGVHQIGDRLEWVDESNGLILPPFDLAADEQHLLVGRLNKKVDDADIRAYFMTLDLLNQSLPALWQAQLALTICHGAVTHLATPLKAHDISIGPFCLESEQHGFKTPCIEITACMFGRGKLYTSHIFQTTFRQQAVLAAPGPIGVDEKMEEKLMELIKANSSGSFEGMRGRSDGSGIKIPLPGVFQNATNGDFSGEDDEGNGLRARLLHFRSAESKTKPHVEYGVWMTQLKGPVSGAAGKWLLLRLIARINQVGIQNFARSVKALSQELLPHVGFTKRADTLAVCLLFMEMICSEVSELTS